MKVLKSKKLDDIHNIHKHTKSLVKNCESYKEFLKNKHPQLPKINSSKRDESIQNEISNHTEYMAFNPNKTTTKNDQKFLLTNDLSNNESMSTKTSFKVLNLEKSIPIIENRPTNFCFGNSIEYYLDTKLDCYNNSKLIINDVRVYLLSRLLFIQSNNYNPNEETYRKTVMQNTKYEMILTLNSAKISFLNGSKESKTSKLVHEIILPISITPFCYLLNEESLKKFISYSINMKKNINETCFNIDTIRYLLRNMNEFKNLINENCDVSLFSHKKVYKMNWFTESEVYEVIINMPTVKLHLVKPNVFITKYLDIDIVFNAFKNTDTMHYYLLHYLNYYKKFRNILNTSFSKYTTRLHNQCLTVDDSNELIPQEDIKRTSYKFNFILSTNDIVHNYFITFYPCTLIVDGKMDSPIQLNLHELRIILLLNKAYGSVHKFVKRLININNEITLNNDYFKNFDFKVFENKERYFFPLPERPSSNALTYLTNSFLSLEQIKSYDSESLLEKEIIIPNELLCKMADNELLNWKYILYDNKDFITENHISKKNFAFNKSNTISNGNAFIKRKLSTKKTLKEKQFIHHKSTINCSSNDL